jgi:MFS transporter, OPA family, glycerol-3-phosphate transporter
VDSTPIDRTDADYRRLRRQVFFAIFVGYAAYYLVRMNLSLAIPDILREFPGYSKAQLGTAMTALSIAYGLSKFLMGSVSDRSNPRWFMPLGLLLSAAVTASFGLFKGIYASLTLIIVLQALNGWFNGMGWPACGKAMVHWFSLSERGRVVSFWNTAHNVGGGLVAALAVVGVGLFGDWGAKFYFNALVAASIAVVVFALLRDAPETCGLPPIEVYRNDLPPNYNAAEAGRTLAFREIFLQHVLNNRFLWAIAVAKGFSFNHASAAWFMFEYAAIPGTLLCGWVSDRIFGGRRGPATILFMGLTLLGLVVYGMNRNGPLWIDMASLIVIGFFVYGPIMMIGLHALELVPKKAAGTAAGFTGFFGYAFGSAIAGTGVGWIADHWGWGGVFATMIVCCVMAMAFVSLTLRRPARAAAASVA